MRHVSSRSKEISSLCHCVSQFHDISAIPAKGSLCLTWSSESWWILQGFQQTKSHVLGLKSYFGWLDGASIQVRVIPVLLSSLLGCSVLLLSQSSRHKTSSMLHLLLDIFFSLEVTWEAGIDSVESEICSHFFQTSVLLPLISCSPGKRGKICPRAFFQGSWAMQTGIHLHTGHDYLFQGSAVSRSLIVFWILVSSFSVSQDIIFHLQYYRKISVLSWDIFLRNLKR